MSEENTSYIIELQAETIKAQAKTIQLLEGRVKTQTAAFDIMDKRYKALESTINVVQENANANRLSYALYCIIENESKIKAVGQILDYEPTQLQTDIKDLFEQNMKSSLVYAGRKSRKEIKENEED